VNIVRFAGRARYNTLLDAGVHVYEWQPTTLHAKTFVVDGQWSTHRSWLERLLERGANMMTRLL